MHKTTTNQNYQTNKHRLKQIVKESIIQTYYNSDSSCVSSCACATTDTVANASQSDDQVALNSIETGRIAEGSYSDQKLDTVDLEFNPRVCNTETIKILPLSRKQVSSNDLKKQYCPSCGHKINDKYKFCPYCGENLKS